MFMNEPTAAEYAAHDAQNALEKSKRLEARVNELEKLVALLLRDSEIRRSIPKGALGLSHLG